MIILALLIGIFSSQRVWGGLVPDKKIYFRDIGLDNFTCTGLCYDSIAHSYWIADFGASDDTSSRKPRLVETNLVSTLSVIELGGGNTVNLQGITFDAENNTLWISIGEKIINIDKSGTEIKHINLKEVVGSDANGIYYDMFSKSLWVLCISDWLVNIDADGNIIKKSVFRYEDQDMITMYNGYLYISVGADYNGNDNYIYKVDPQDCKVVKKIRLLESYAVEGICFHKGSLMVLNDGLYHNAKIKESYFSIFNNVNF